MDIKKVYVLSILCLCLSMPLAYAQDTLTWQDCVRQAKESNHELASAVEDILQAISDKDISLSAALAQVNIDASARRSKSSGKEKTNSYSYGVSGTKLIFDGFKTASEITVASNIVQAQRYNYALVSSNIRLDLRQAFIGLMRTQELVHITEEIAERRRQNLELIKLRYNGGREHRGALLTAEADLAQAEFEVEQSKRDIVLSGRELVKQLGAPAEAPLKVKGEFTLKTDYIIKPDIDHLAETTPFLQEIISRKDAAIYNVNSREADFMPKVYLGGSLGRVNNQWPPRNTEWSTGLSVSLPVFEGGNRVSQLSKARSQLNQSISGVHGGRDTALVTLERSWKDLRDAITNVSVQRKFLEAANERAKITRAQYSTGLASFNDWIIIEDNLVKAQKAHLNARAEMLIAEAYWIQATGGTLEYDEE
jgi:outer membrane protein TolC